VVVPVVVPPDVPEVPVVVCANTEVAIAVKAKVTSNLFIFFSYYDIALGNIIS
jgi:hypothetical protein